MYSDNYLSPLVLPHPIMLPRLQAQPHVPGGWTAGNSFSRPAGICAARECVSPLCMPARIMTVTGAEDRATVGTDLSAVSGAKTEWGGTMPPSTPFGIGTHALNPPGPN